MRSEVGIITRTGVWKGPTKVRFAARACIALGGGSAIFQGLCAAGQLFCRRRPAIDVVSIGLPVGVGMVLLAAARCLRTPQRGSEETTLGPAGARPGTVEPDPEIAYSIIVPVYNRPGDVAALLERLSGFAEKWAPLGRGEIVVVDDGSTDGTCDVVRSWIARNPIETRVISQKNMGSAGARNTGFASARGAMGVSIDSDSLPDEDWLPNLLHKVRPDEAAAVFGAVRSDRRARMPMEVSPAGIEFITASFAMPVGRFFECGGFFPGFNGQFRDDTDFLLSARRAGVSTLQANDAVVWHPIRRFATLKAVWRASVAHRFDVLLVARHGEAATPFVSSILLGGSWWGNFPTSCVLLGALWVFLFSTASRLGGHRSVSLLEQGMGWAALLLAFVALSLLGVLYHRVPFKDVPRYVGSVAAYVAGATTGRIMGSLRYGFALL